MKISSKKSYGIVKLFTHNDLDGIGSAVLVNKVYGDYVETEMINANKTDEIINNWLDNCDLNCYSAVFITDLSVNQQTADRLESLRGSQFSIVLLDHHETASHLIGRDWCYVRTTKEYCGTNLTHWYLTSSGHDLSSYNEFVRNVHSYDCWLWKEANESLPNDLNNLLYIIGKKRFFQRFLNDPSTEFGDSEKVLLMLDAEKCRNYIWSRMQQYYKLEVTLGDGSTKVLGVVHGEQYVNDLAHHILENDKTVQGALVVGYTSFSFRSRNPEEFNLTNLTVPLGGGGHVVSGGAYVPVEYRMSSVLKFMDSKGVPVKVII